MRFENAFCVAVTDLTLGKESLGKGKSILGIGLRITAIKLYTSIVCRQGILPWKLHGNSNSIGGVINSGKAINTSDHYFF